MSTSPMPSPPLPSPHSAVLEVIVRNAVEPVRTSKASAEEATLHTAVHGWYERRIQREDECPGCDFRGRLPKPDPSS
ncbi:hypothetical protein [Kitasatospora cineracea]|uniref:hypothetical protein n=1 Tax=Kitasatospora cineracea TaxID=88074 RepID=UPI0037F9AC52